MTVCAFLAASAHADSQRIMAVSPYQMTRPYSIVPIAGQVSYTNAFDNNMMPASQSGLWPAYSMPFYRFKREAEPDLPFEVRSKMTSPLSRQEYKVQVDRMGNGQSYQHVERQMVAPLASRRYSTLRDQMEDNRQRLRDQQRMDMDRQRMVYNMDRQRMMDREQQRMDMDRQRMMDREQQRMDINRQRMDLERERMMSGMDRQRNMDMMTMNEDRMDRYMDQEDNSQMIQTHRMMIKREAESDPAFSYTVMSEHPSETIRPFYQLPAMARQEYMSPSQQMTMKQIHPDGAFSYVRLPAVNFPSTTSLYNMLNRIRPVAMAWA
jgi:hypothetical protein